MPVADDAVTDRSDPWTDAMRCGDFAAAWSIADRAMTCRNPADRDDPSLPYHLRWVWDGRAFDGKAVLVRCYHGLGDTLMFARFLPLLARRAAFVTVEMQPRLVPLFQGFPGVGRLVPFDVAAPLPPQDCDLAITELPLALRATPADAGTPYLDVPAAELPPQTVALCWQSGDWDAGRSVPADLFHPLCARAALSLVTAPTSLPVLNPRGCSMDLELTARLIAGSALLVTVDTMVAHLGGALGRPVWLLLKHDPDWRWPIAAARTPWYPSTRIFHQAVPGNWSDVMAEVAGELDRLFTPSTSQRAG